MSEPIEVELVGLTAFGAIGVTAAEREVGRKIELDITFRVADSAAVADDHIDGTVDYGAVATVATEVVTTRSCRTLEHLCGLIADALAERFELSELVVRAAKPEPPIPQSIAQVAVTLRRPG